MNTARMLENPSAEADALSSFADAPVTAADLEKEMSLSVRRLGYHGYDAWAVSRGTLGDPICDQNLWAADYAPNLVKSFLKSGLAVDCPITAHAAHTAAPFDYVTQLAEGPQNSAARWQARTLRLFGVAHAWVVPLNTVEQMRGVTIYLKGDRPAATKHFTATRHAVHLLASAFMDAFVRLNSPSLPKRNAIEPVRLSTRETDCLQWVARGKTNWEISCILNISENTVRHHLKNAFGKLDTTSRSGAVQKSISLGLIAKSDQ
ncbi:MAG: helix-turn-helix transcriptional regulator [Pseudomonadota bacterium]